MASAYLQQILAQFVHLMPGILKARPAGEAVRVVDDGSRMSL